MALNVGIACGWQDGPATLERLVATADVVVHGTIVEVIGVLLADQQDVWTHYNECSRADRYAGRRLTLVEDFGSGQCA